MSLLLSLIGLWLIYWSWGLIVRMDEKKINRKFRSWFTEVTNKEESEGYRIAGGVLFALGILFFGICMVVIGIVGLFS